MNDTLVFLGPSLPLDQARLLLAAEYHPPVRMGDVYRLLTARVRRLVIIDGVFHGVPSVWHREILDAMAEGVEVIGAASMGALRAAELHTLGMLGHGTIFEWYRDGVIDGDDEVALLHGEADTGYPAVSTPLVNLRATIAALEAAAIITSGEGRALIGWLKALSFEMRSLHDLARSPLLQAWPAGRTAQVIQAARDRFVDLKRADAIATLRHLAVTPAIASQRPVPHADRPERVMWRIGRALRGGIPSANGPVAGQFVADALETGPVRDALLRDLSERAFLVAWAGLRGVTLPPQVTATARSRWLAERAGGAGAEAAWLHANGLTAAAADRLLREWALAEWLRSGPPQQFGLAHAADSGSAFVADWLRAHGFDGDTAALAAWAIGKGPACFGLPYYDDAALIDELRRIGRAAELAGDACPR